MAGNLERRVEKLEQISPAEINYSMVDVLKTLADLDHGPERWGWLLQITRIGQLWKSTGTVAASATFSVARPKLKKLSTISP